MSAPTIRALVAVDATIDSRTVELVVDDPHIEVVGVIDQASGQADPAAADVLLVACGDGSEEALQFVASARERGGHPVVVVCGGSPNGFVGDVLSSGADDIVLIEGNPTPGPATYFAMRKAMARRTRASVQSTDGSLVCVLGPKGGIGKTLTAANLGVALADAGHRTAIVDLDLQFGDLGLARGGRAARPGEDQGPSGGQRLEGTRAAGAHPARPGRRDHAGLPQGPV